MESTVVRADDLAAQGRFSEAIDILTACNREQRDPSLEARLVTLRRDARAAMSGSRGPRRWPARVKDHFRGVVGPPEIDAAALTPDLLRSGILRHGCLVVRGFLPPDTVARLVEDRARAFAARDAFDAGAPESETAPWFVPFDLGPEASVIRRFATEGGGVLTVESPRALFDLIEAFEAAGVGPLLTEYLGERPMLLAKKWTLRRVSPDHDQHDWHQDGAFMGRDIRSINIWVTLSDCGVDAPGLELVARRLGKIVPTGTHGANFDWTVGEGMVDKVAKGTRVVPKFAAGDAVLFDHMLLHRTSVRLGMRESRDAIEAWFAAPSSYPAEQLPIAY